MRNLVVTRFTDWTVIRPIIISLLNHEGQPIPTSTVRKLYITVHSALIVGHTDIPGKIKTDFLQFQGFLSVFEHYNILPRCVP